MTNKLRELFELHGLMSMRKQRAFANYLGAHAFEFDSAAGTMSFPAQAGPAQGQSRLFGVEVLGVEHVESQTWTWSWAPEAPDWAGAHSQSALRFKALGEDQGIEELTVSRLPLSRVSGQLLGSIALGALEQGAYYRGAVGGVFGLFLLSAPPALPPLGGAEFVGVLGDAISNFEFRNHRQAVDAFLQQLGWEADRSQGTSWTVQAEDGVQVVLHFDDRDRLAKLSTRAATPA